MAMGTLGTGPRNSSPSPHLFPFLLVLLLPRLPLSRSASAVTHLPGFNGRLPFHLETGYVGVEEETGTELFYYFVESERSPATDPVILWLTGGPACSGFSGMVFEVGPLNFVLAPYDGSLPQLVYNPYSWSKIASIIFLDTPVGAGFSYARDHKAYSHVGDFSSSSQVVTFLNKWFTDHPSYISNPFYLGGSSYAGMVIPLIAHYISEETEIAEQQEINLKGYMIGNPITGSDFVNFNSRMPYAHSVGMISDQLYEAAIENCKGDYVTPTNRMCDEVLKTFNSLISEVDQGYILGDKCPIAAPKPVNDDLIRLRLLREEDVQLEKSPHPTINCFSYRYYLSNIWANDRRTRDALRIKQGTIGEWVRCPEGFPYTFEVPSSIEYQLNLTTKGYRALVISGDHDMMVPFLGTQAWIRSLNFSVVDDWRAWHVDGQCAGFTIAYANHMTFATVKGGGHTAISYRPKQGLAMAQRWLDDKPL